MVGLFCNKNYSICSMNYLQIRGVLVHFHVLWDDEGVYLIDGGFIGGIRKIERFLKSHGFAWSDVKALVLTHGHLDHTLNVRRIQEKSGCLVYAPQMDALHISGKYPYEGAARLCGLAEAVGRFFLRYQPPHVDRWIGSEDVLPIWGGLRVIHLPGHTLGHSGLLSVENKLLFAADLFTNHIRNPKLPPTVFNVDDEMNVESVKKAAALDIEGVLLNHSRVCSPEESLADLKALAALCSYTDQKK